MWIEKWTQQNVDRKEGKGMLGCSCKKKDLALGAIRNQENTYRSSKE